MDVKWGRLSPPARWAIVVEDDPTLRMLMVEILAEIGLQSVDFETADEALTYLLNAKDGCPLVIVDYGLPGQIQGAEFIEMVKSKWPSTAAILTSGYELAPVTVPLGTTYLHKPWSMEDLVMAVADLLQPGRPLPKNE